MVQEVYIIDDDDSSILVFRELFKNDPEYKFINIKSEQIDVALKNIPFDNAIPMRLLPVRIKYIRHYGTAI